MTAFYIIITHPSPRITFQNRTIPCFAPPHLPPLSKVRCCRPKKFGRLPEGLLLHQPSQNRTISLAFRNANICMHQYVFASALSFSLFVGEWACPSRFTEYCHPHNHCKRTLITCLSCPSRCIDPLYFYNLLKSTSIASPRAKLASLVKGEVLSPEKIRATTGGIAQQPFAPHNLPNPHYPLLCTITLASLVKGEVLSPEKIRATTGGIVTPPTLPKPHYLPRFS